MHPFLPTTMAAFVSVVLSSLAGAAAPNVVADTRFNRERGFYDSGFAVVIQSRTAGARIRYTTDGSAPSPTHGLGDENPVVVRIESTTTLRAMAYKAGLTPSNVDTHTYIFPSHVVRQPRYPSGFPTSLGGIGMGGLTELDYEMDPAIVDHVDYRREILSAMTAIPSLSIVMDKQDLFGQLFTDDGELKRSESGVYFRSQAEPGMGPASVELIYPRAPDRGFQVDCAVESHADYGAKRALKLVFKNEYGVGKLRSKLMQDAPLNGKSATTTFDRLVLRSGHTRSFAGGDAGETTYARDQWSRDTEIAMTGLGAHGTFVHLYLNGFYWGLYNLAERPDGWFTSAYLGGEKSDWMAVNHKGVLHGDDRRWHYLRGPLKNKDMRVLQNYRDLQQSLDVEHFADYIILAWYSRLYDWGPDRNWYGGNRNEPPGPFRFFMWDAEYTLFSGAAPMAWVHGLFTRSAATRSGDMVGIWHALAQSPEFMTLFADRVYQHCFHGALTEERSIARWRRLVAFIESAVVAESARWGDARKALGEPTRTRNDTFLRQVRRVEAVMTGNVSHFIEVLREEDYYPRIDPPEPTRISTSSVTLVQAQGVEIYVTRDGSDPRAIGGAVSKRAERVRSGDSIALEGATKLKARARDGLEWSALRVVAETS